MTSIHVRKLESRVARTAARFVDLAAREGLAVADLPAARLPWYEIRNEAGDDPAEPATVLIFDEIGGSWGISAEQFARDLEAITAPTIRVRINSPGGAVFEAIAIHSALLHHPARIEVYVDGYAASAASVIAMAGDEIVMMPGSEMMIHDASATHEGNAGDMANLSTWLDRQSDNIAELYRQRAGGDAAEWRDLMLAETWMFANEAVDMGLADRVYERPAPVDEVMTRSFDLAKFGYRYTGRRSAPAPGQQRQRTVARVGGRQRGDETPRSVVTNRRHATAMDLRTAARERAAGAAEAGYRLQQHRGASTPPAGRARSLPFPAQLRATLETRRGQELYHLIGQATVFGVRYEMWDEFGPYWEKVDRHAADDTLAANPDVAFLVNHRGVTMARTTNGTLELRASSGIDVDAWLNPKRQDVTDFVTAVEDANVTEMSLAFMLDDGFWNQDFSEFTIARMDLNRGDVSGVNYGANPHTSISARQREVLGELERMSPALARASLSRLLERRDLDLDELFDGFDRARVGNAERDVAKDIDQTPQVRHVAQQPATAVTPQRTGRSIANIEALLLD